MILVASALAGVAVYLLVGMLLGHLPAFGFTMGSRSRSHKGRDRMSDVQLWLRQAGTQISVAEFFLGCAGAGVLAFLVVWAVTVTPVVALVPAVSIAMAPRVYFGRRRAARLSELQRAWPDGIRHIIGGIQSGLSLNQAAASLATSGPPALRQAFERFALSAHMVGTAAALEIVRGQLAHPTSDRVIEVLILAHERGGRIVTEVLEDLAEATTKDLRATEAIESERLEQKINARAVFALPWFVLALLTATPGDIRNFYNTDKGVLVVMVGGVMSLLGLWIVSRLARDLPEPRVFSSAPPPPAAAIPPGGGAP
ncbi:MAG: type II secretion system F family protein [Actinomycetota bacterium]